MMKTINDFNVKGKRVLIRCDFNVPLKNKKIKNDFRIQQALPTINYLIKNKAEVILMSHLGRPEGKTILKLSLGPVEKRLKELGLKNFVLLENLRFDKREEENNESLAKSLAQKADIYINDAFGVCHRKNASVTAITKFLPAGAGFLLQKEIKVLSNVMKKPARPLMAVIGGAKLKTKARVIDNFLKIADYVLVGGKIAFSPELKRIKSPKMILSIDTNNKCDIGPKTIKEFSKIIKTGKTILWAGPLGVFERTKYETGTKRIAQEIAKNKKAFKVAGGGDTIAAVFKFNLQNKFDHLSTGGGAMLAFLGREKLPGLQALNYYAKNKKS